MFIPLKMVLIGLDPYPHDISMIKMNVWSNPKVLIDQQRDAQTGAM